MAIQWLKLGILFVTFLLRVGSLDAQGLWRDEVDQWRFAFQSLPELLGNFLKPGWNGPLYSPLLRAWVGVAGQSVFAMRLLSVFWDVLGVGLAVALAQRLAGRRVSLAAGLLIAVSPYMTWYAQEIKMYTWVPMLVLLALYALDRACRQPRRAWWLVVFAATTLAIYSHILAALLIPVLGLWFLLHPMRDPRAWLGGGVVLGALTLPYLPLLAWQWPLLWQTRETGYPDLTFGEMASALLNGWSAGVSQGAWGTPEVLLAITVGTTAVASVGLGWLWVGRGPRRSKQLGLWLALPLVLVWAISQRGPIFTDRYLIWSLPAFCILLAGGVVTLGRAFRPAGLVALAGLATIAMHGWVAQAAIPIKPEFEAAVEVVESQRGERDLLVFQIPYNHHVFNFYATDGLGAWVEAPYTNWREADSSYRVDSDMVGRQMRGLVAGYDRIWLIYSEYQLWDERELVKSWLRENYDLAQQVDFHGVSLLLFRRPPR
ncbi:MAG: glycosyltransferase family 39 protein [Anaerolineae bacterium]|nr:glycosyltransferase family 39 protein [Anaerolineae bacterium]